MQNYYYQKRTLHELKLHQIFTPKDESKLFELFVLFEAIESFLKNGYEISADGFRISSICSYLDDTSFFCVLFNKAVNSYMEIYYQKSDLIDDALNEHIKALRLGKGYLMDLVFIKKQTTLQVNLFQFRFLKLNYQKKEII